MKCFNSRKLLSRGGSILVSRSNSLKESIITDVSHRSLVSLRERHKKFLDLVDSHGTGSVTLTYDYDKKIATLSLSNEQLHNSISGRMMNELATALDTLLKQSSYDEEELDDMQKGKVMKKKVSENARTVVGVIVRSSGKTFCAGADLNLVRDIVNTPETGIFMSQFMTDAFTRLRTSGFITVCLLNGSAVGGGAEIATVCDYRLMTDAPDKHICFIHAKLGATPGWGAASRLVSILGRQKALKLLATSVRVSASEALELGLVDEIVSNSDDSVGQPREIIYSTALMEAAENFLLPFTSQPFMRSVAAVKTLVASNEILSRKHVVELEQKVFGERWASKDNKKATTKSPFRPPVADTAKMMRALKSDREDI